LTRLAPIRRQVNEAGKMQTWHHARERVEMMVNFLDKGVR
jgi:hypothetical protein